MQTTPRRGSKGNIEIVHCNESEEKTKITKVINQNDVHNPENSKTARHKILYFTEAKIVRFTTVAVK